MARESANELQETRRLLVRALDRVRDLESVDHSRSTSTTTSIPESRPGIDGGENSRRNPSVYAILRSPRLPATSPYPYRPIGGTVAGSRLSLSLKRSIGHVSTCRPTTELSDAVAGPSTVAGRTSRERLSIFKGKQKMKRPKLSKWKHDVICLTYKDQDRGPGSLEKADLLNAGLGPRTIEFMEFGNSLIFHDELMEAFPKLEDGGSYVLLRTGEGKCRDLSIIPAPVGSYTAQYLKSIVQTAKIYVRPGIR